MQKAMFIYFIAVVALQFGALPLRAEDSKFLEDSVPSASSDGRQFMSNRKGGLPEDLDRTLYQVRCWQNGNLIIDEKHWRVPQIHSAFAAFRDTPQARPGLYLLEFGHAICQVKAQGEDTPAAPEPPPAAKRNR